MRMKRYTRSQKAGERDSPKTNLSVLIKEYQREHRPRLIALLEGFRQLDSLRTAISTAARGLTPDRRRHPHQRRLTSGVLKEASRRLLRHISEIEACRSHDELHKIVEQHTFDLKGFGELARYDTSLRIGAYMNLLPTKVHLHAGTRTGAQAFGFGHYDSLDSSAIPQPLRKLKPYEIEDFLCLFKGRLKNIGERRMKLARVRRANRGNRIC